MLQPAVTPNRYAEITNPSIKTRMWAGELGRVTARSDNLATWRHITTGTELDIHVSELTALVPATA